MCLRFHLCVRSSQALIQFYLYSPHSVTLSKKFIATILRSNIWNWHHAELDSKWEQGRNPMKTRWICLFLHLSVCVFVLPLFRHLVSHWLLTCCVEGAFVQMVGPLVQQAEGLRQVVCRPHRGASVSAGLLHQTEDIMRPHMFPAHSTQAPEREASWTHGYGRNTVP